MPYTKSKNVLFLVALMKKHGVRHLVLSPGARNIPLVHSVETDDYFTCYSVVDERSAAYFAMGLSQRLNEPVAISCTSSVAASNYLPGITEAFHLHVPLLVLTADRNPHYVGQMENQMIDQVDMYGSVCKRCVNLPVIKDAEDEWYCQRLINEALLELRHHGSGPVQVNYPVFGGLSEFPVDELPEVQVIRRYEMGRSLKDWKECADVLASAKRILVICGEGSPSSRLDDSLERFSAKYNCIVSVEHISNVHASCADDLFLAAQVIPVKEFVGFLPEVVITFGNNYVSRFKDLLRTQAGSFEHWAINASGEVCDTLKSQSKVFECDAEEFFDSMADLAPEGSENDMEYRNMWLRYDSCVPRANFKFSNAMAIQKLARLIPSGSLVHTGILNSTRIMQHYALSDGVDSYCNVGAYGIDGSMSTFFGQARATSSLCFLVLGDLSFFYDMNSLQIQGASNNIRIMVLNNSGAAEFHYFVGREKIPTINDYIAAQHNSSVRGWVESRGIRYLNASDEVSLIEALDTFVKPSQTPVVLEVFTDKELDAKYLKGYYSSAAKIAKQKYDDIIAPNDNAPSHEGFGLKAKLGALLRK